MKQIPNILSAARAVLSCAVLVLLSVLDPGNRVLWILLPGGLFLIACITDYLDGNLARKYNVVSDLGKFLDPIADKLLIVFAMMGFLYRDADRGLPVLYIALAVTLLREFSISSLRMLAARQGVVMAADMIGKCKTVVQMIAIGAYFFFIDTPLIWIAQVLMGAATVLCILSGIHYIRSYLASKK